MNDDVRRLRPLVPLPAMTPVSRRPARLDFLWGSFLAFSVLLAYAIPDSLYANSHAARVFANFVSRYLGAIGQFASVSDFPGTTRIVLATLAVLVPPLALLQWRVPGYMTWQPPPNVSRMVLFGLAFFILAMTLLLPVVFQVDPAELELHIFTSYATRAMSRSRFWLGFLAGAYAVCSAWLWALLPRLVSAMFTRKEKPLDTRR
jgi:hypothetical protein